MAIILFHVRWADDVNQNGRQDLRKSRGTWSVNVISLRWNCHPVADDNAVGSSQILWFRSRFHDSEFLTSITLLTLNTLRSRQHGKWDKTYLACDTVKNTISWAQLLYYMMTSSNGNIFRVTGLLSEEFTGHRRIIITKASDAELLCFLWSVLE